MISRKGRKVFRKEHKGSKNLTVRSLCRTKYCSND